MNFYGIKSKAEKIDGGFHKLRACFHQRHFCRQWGNLRTPYIMEYNGNDQSQNLEWPLFYILKYMKNDFMCS